MSSLTADPLALGQVANYPAYLAPACCCYMQKTSDGTCYVIVATHLALHAVDMPVATMLCVAVLKRLGFPLAISCTELGTVLLCCLLGLLSASQV